MTMNELLAEMEPLVWQLNNRADAAEADDFAPWVVGAIRDAAALLKKLDNRQ